MLDQVHNYYDLAFVHVIWINTFSQKRKKSFQSPLKISTSSVYEPTVKEYFFFLPLDLKSFYVQERNETNTKKKKQTTQQKHDLPNLYLD